MSKRETKNQTAMRMFSEIKPPLTQSFLIAMNSTDLVESSEVALHLLLAFLGNVLLQSLNASSSSLGQWICPLHFLIFVNTLLARTFKHFASSELDFGILAMESNVSWVMEFLTSRCEISLILSKK